MKKQEKKSVEETATKNFNELIESCENLTINQKRVAFKRIIQDEVEPGEVGVLVRQKLNEHLETLDANTGLKLEGKAMRKQAKKDSTSKEVTIPCKKCNKQTHRENAKYCSNCGLKR